MGVFVRKYHKYLRKNEMQHSEKNIVNYRQQSKTSKQDDDKKSKSRGSCFNCEKPGHYKPDCPLLKRDKGKDKFQRIPNKARRAYIAWKSDSEESNKSVSSNEEETIKFCLMAHQGKKKKVKHSKYDHSDKMSHLELQKAFEALHHEDREAFKRLASNKKIFSYLEHKFPNPKRNLKLLRNL